MPRDARLQATDYFGGEFNRRTKLNFKDLFETTAEGDRYPWSPSRFDSEKLLTYAESKKRNLNRDLNYVDPNNPFDFELFEGLGRFRKEEEYDFQLGEPLTKNKPQQQLNFNPTWMELYRLSPTIKPDERAKNPMPSAANPDPNGYLMATVQNQVNQEDLGDTSISSLVSKSSSPPTKKEEQQGEEEIKKAEEEEPAINKP